MGEPINILFEPLTDEQMRRLAVAVASMGGRRVVVRSRHRRRETQPEIRRAIAARARVRLAAAVRRLAL